MDRYPVDPRRTARDGGRVGPAPDDQAAGPDVQPPDPGWRRLAARARADHESARDAAARESGQLESARLALTDAAAARDLVQRLAVDAQVRAHRQVAAVVTECLRAVFGAAAYEFRVRFERRRGKTEADLVFVRDGQEFDPVGSTGGGVVDVGAFALRLAALILGRPAYRRVLLLDEPMKHLSRDHAPRVRELLERLCADLNMQIVLVTHNPDLACGAVVEL